MALLRFVKFMWIAVEHQGMSSEDDRELRAYLRDAQRVSDEIWTEIDVGGKVVIDVGVGDSTRRLAELGAEVVAVERDLKKVQKLEPSVPVLICDFLNFPFRRKVADAVVFSFVLHEMNPEHHLKALSIAGKIAPRVIIVEPVPYGCPAYEEFARIWRNAMHSIGRFEEYKPPSYWGNILEKAGFKVVFRRLVNWKVAIPRSVLEDIVRTTAEDWKKKGVSERWIRALQGFLQNDPKMKWSDIVVILGKV